MALLFVDSFQHYATADTLKKWTSWNSSTTIDNSGGRGGRGSVYNNAGYLTKALPAASANVIAGFAYKLSQVISSGDPFFGIGQSSGSDFILICLNADGSISVRRVGGGSGFIGTSRPGVIATGLWNYIEIKAVCHASAGTVEVRVNGVTEINLTAQNTNPSGSGAYTSVALGSPYGGLNGCRGYSGDFYICDTAGSSNNDFLGDIRVDAYMPSSEGVTQQFTPTPSGTHYSTVDEANPNTTDYVTGSAGQTELFGYTDVANTPTTIFGVQACSAVNASDAGAASVRNVAHIGSTNYSGSVLALSTSQRYLSEVWGTSPATSAAWTKTEINAAQFGLTVA